jgi:hypothetical protein
MIGAAAHQIERTGLRTARGTLPLTVLLLTAGLVGCGGPVGHVEGQITNQGQTVPRADLVFTLENQPAAVFYGVSRDDGIYVLDEGERGGLPVGKYQVVVTEYVLPDGTPLPAGEAGAAIRGSDEATARRHSLTKDVAAGMNKLDLKLEEAQLLSQGP